VLLYPDEVDRIRARTDELNAVIANVGGAAGAIPIDIHAIFGGIAAHGYHIGGLTLTTTFATGGIFSADGFHPNSIGQAIAADEVIKALNAAKHLAIPEPNLAAAIFTPDVPPGTASASAPGLDFSEQMRRQLYACFPPVTAGIQILEPESPIYRVDPRARPEKNRTVERPGEHKD
jgi:hypothetical protein